MPDTRHTTPAATLAALRAEMQRRGLDAFLLPRFDAHQGEYVADHDARLAHVTGFTGSAGLAVITQSEAAVFVDGRYTVQVAQECPTPPFTHCHLFETPPEHWLAERLQPGWQVGLDQMHWPPAWADRFAAVCDGSGAALAPLADNPVDAIWADQPAPPMGRVEAFPLQFAGRSTAEKAADLAADMARLGADWQVETQPDNIAWLLNVRGADTEFVPVPNSFLLLHRDGRICWFVAAAKLEEGLRARLADTVEVLPQQEFLSALQTRVSPGDLALVDPLFSPMAARQVLRARGARVEERISLLTLAKAQKNQTELEGLRACHLEDGRAWTEFTAWIAEEVPARAAAGTPLRERDMEAKILSLRQQNPGFLASSFNPISAAGGNAAMCHYATSDLSNAPVLPDQPYLLDSGGHYDTGTTDATRSYAFAAVRPEGYDRAYTAVFKAFHALATLRFPPGTQGHHIDAICRRPLWDLGLDFDHGTGHGVGHRLSVHEHPQRIGKPVSPVDLVPGMVLSIEPGHYVAGRYGIRIENLFAIVAESDGFMVFENLTWAPIQTDMLIKDQLSAAETGWLKGYHADLRQRLGPQLSPRAQAYLARL